MAMNQLETLDALIDCLTAQAANLNHYKTDVGASNQDVTDVIEMLANLIAIRDFCDVVGADKQAAFAIKTSMFRGVIGESVAAPPVFPTLTFATTPLSGSREITMNRNKRFMLGPKYSAEIGEALLIEAPKKASLIPGEQKPDLHLFGAATNHHFSCVVEKRAESDMWQLWVQRKGGGWELQGTYNGKSIDVSMTLTTPGEPEQILCRVQLRKNNEDYGQPSDPAYVTLNP